MTGSRPIARGLYPDYPIRTARIDLRPHRPDDLDDLLAFHSDPEVVRYIPWPVRNREQTRAALKVKMTQGVLSEPGQWLVLAMELRETGCVVGEVLLKWADEHARQGELGFALNREHQGRGLGAEAAQAVLSLGFDALGLHRITAVCIAENVASARLLRRLGMQQEAHLRDNVFLKGRWADQLVFGLLVHEWRRGAAARRPDVVSAADRAELDRLVKTFFGAFTSEPGAAARMAELRRSFLPRAVIVRTSGAEPGVFGVDEFLTPREQLLTDGTLVGFREWPLSGRLEVFGDVAHWFGSYRKQGVQTGVRIDGHGMKSLQFVRTGSGWRISAAAWDDEREEFPVSEAGRR